MIRHKSFTARLLVGTGANKQDELRRQAERFIAVVLDEDDVISITEWASTEASAVTVWYRSKEEKSDTGLEQETN